MNRRFPLLLVWITALPLAGCGTGTLDLAGYPDKSHDQLYSNGRIGGDKGLVDFDLRKALRDL